MKIKTAQEFEELTAIVTRMAALKFFPQQDQAVLAIVEDVARLVPSLEQARWLVNRMRELFDEWPGPVTLRETYIDRFPAACAKEPKQIESPQRAYLSVGIFWEDKEATWGPWPEELLLKANPSVARPKETPLLIPGKDFKPITADDIEEARRKLARQRASSVPPDLG